MYVKLIALGDKILFVDSVGWMKWTTLLYYKMLKAEHHHDEAYDKSLFCGSKG
jgi:hypothetical protein